MSAVREQLFVSTFWSIRRPKAALTAGHFVIRLNDPAIAFSVDSSNDLLDCYHRLVAAMVDLHGPVVAQVYVALNWQPVGDAIGEPVAETSTPTLHVFLHGAGLPAASPILQMPAHDRVPYASPAGADAAVRTALRSEAGSAASPSGALPEVTFRINELSDVQWTAVLEPSSSTLNTLSAARLLELAATLESFHSRSVPPFSGATLWACEQGHDGENGAATITIFGRRHGQAENPVADFSRSGALDIPAQPS